MDNKLKSILFVGLVKDTNLGDPLIVETVIKLFKAVARKEFRYDIFDLKSFSTTTDSSHQFSVNIEDLFIGPASKTRSQRERISYQAKAIKNFIAQYDAVIICGGGIINYRFYYMEHIGAIIEACEEEKIPLIINSVGIEEYSTEDEDFQFWRNYLNSGCIKYFSTRDYVADLRNDWMVNKKIITDFVPDNVIALNRTIDCRKSEKGNGNIGIGLIRDSIFKDFYGSEKSDNLLYFYSHLIIELEKRGIKYEVFTNGVPTDLNLLPKIEAYVGHKIIVRIPKSSDDLINIISSFKGLIVARMHAMIIAYSLGIPFVALDWHRKIKAFNSLIKNDYIYELDKANPIEAVNGLLEVVNKNDSDQLREVLIDNILNSTKNIVNNILNI